MPKDKPIIITDPAEEPLLEATLDDAWTSITNTKTVMRKEPGLKDKKYKKLGTQSRKDKENWGGSAMQEAFRKAQISLNKGKIISD